MALSGLVLVLFIIGHMLGNLKLFAGIDPVTGQYKLDLYAEFLRVVGAPLFGRGELLWLARGGLIVAVFLHILTAFQLTRMGHDAREHKYKRYRYEQGSYAARTMRWGGVILALFIVYHLLHLTFGAVHSDGFVHGKVFSNLMLGFKVWYITLAYLIANAFLFMHLYHGVWSMCHTLGLANPDTSSLLKCGAKGLATLLFLGYVSVPLAIFFGVVN